MNIEKLRPSVASSIVFNIGAFFSMIFAIFLLNRSLFLSLDLVRLAAVGIALTFALSTINAMIMATIRLIEKFDPEFVHKQNNEEVEIQFWTGIGFFSSLFTNLSLALVYFSGSSFRDFFIFLFSSEAIFFLGLLTIYLSKKAKFETNKVKSKKKETPITDTNSTENNQQQ